MTDIRKHGFESDAQWREYLAEIEETEVFANSAPADDRNALRQLAVLRTEVIALRERLVVRMRHDKRRQQWRILAAGVLLLLLTMRAGRTMSA
jgi:hypothetical protein